MDKKSKRKFVVITTTDKLKLKAQTSADRDKWVSTLKLYTLDKKDQVIKASP